MPLQHIRNPLASAGAFVVARIDRLVVETKTVRAYALPVPALDENRQPIRRPYFGVQLAPVQTVRFTNRRAMVEVEATVTAIGPDHITEFLRAMGAAADEALEDSAPATGPDGANVLHCRQTNPLEYSRQEGDQTIRYVGAVYGLAIN